MRNFQSKTKPHSTEASYDIMPDKGWFQIKIGLFGIYVFMYYSFQSIGDLVDSIYG